MLDRVTPTPRELRWLAGFAAAVVGIAIVQGARWRAPAPAMTVVLEPARGLRLDVNTAAWYELDALPGIGETTARKIVAEREAHGRYASLDDLTRVAGLSAKRVQAIAPHLVAPE